MKYQPNRNYVSNARVMTPRPLARAIVDALEPSGLLLEPCAGDGAFVEALTPYGEVEWCELDRGRDFLAWPTSRRVDWIITNPPWSQFRQFLEHSLAVADHVCFLAPLPHWFTKRRMRSVRDAGFGYKEILLVDWPPVRGWREQGFLLGTMHIVRGYEWPCEVSWRSLNVTYDIGELIQGHLWGDEPSAATLLGSSC